MSLLHSAIFAIFALTFASPATSAWARSMNPDQAAGNKGKSGDKAAKHRKDRPSKGKPGKPSKDKPSRAKGTATGAGDAMDGSHAEDRFTRIKRKAMERKQRRASRASILRKKARMRARAALGGKRMDQALKQELRRHARRLARLHRVHELAAEAANADAATRVEKLIDHEQKRHMRWMSVYARGGKPGNEQPLRGHGNGKGAEQ